VAKEFGRGFVTGAGKRDKKPTRAPKQITPEQQPQQQFDPYAPETINLYQTGPSAPIATAQPPSVTPSSVKPPSVKPPSVTPSSVKPPSVKPRSVKPRSVKPPQKPVSSGQYITPTQTVISPPPEPPPETGGFVTGRELSPQAPPMEAITTQTEDSPDALVDTQMVEGFVFGEDAAPQPGCTVTYAVNYNAGATYDDGSCDFEEPGCIDPAARNYSGYYSVIWEGGINYSRLGANVDDGSCLFSTYTCTDSQALNWNSACPPSDQFIGDGMWITEYSQFRLSIPLPGTPNANQELVALPETIQNKLNLNDPVVFTPTSGPIEGRVPYLITSLVQVSVDDKGTNYMAQVEAVTTELSSY